MKKGEEPMSQDPLATLTKKRDLPRWVAPLTLLLCVSLLAVVGVPWWHT